MKLKREDIKKNVTKTAKLSCYFISTQTFEKRVIVTKSFDH